jgi:hypothetical protein
MWLLLLFISESVRRKFRTVRRPGFFPQRSLKVKKNKEGARESSFIRTAISPISLCSSPPFHHYVRQ